MKGKRFASVIIASKNTYLPDIITEPMRCEGRREGRDERGNEGREEERKIVGRKEWRKESRVGGKKEEIRK